VVLLLVTCTLQVVEISHQHGTLDAAEHCLLCKANGHAATDTEAPAVAGVHGTTAIVTPPSGRAARPAHALPPARGPPVTA
jgi:hypothetical protein